MFNNKILIITLLIIVIIVIIKNIYFVNNYDTNIPNKIIKQEEIKPKEQNLRRKLKLQEATEVLEESKVASASAVAPLVVAEAPVFVAVEAAYVPAPPSTSWADMD